MSTCTVLAVTSYLQLEGSGTCNYSEADNQYGTTTYQWSKSGVALQTSGQTLHFSSLRTLDAGQYTCSVTMRSVTLSYDHDITVQSNKVNS